jgi:hypothetical protein
MAVARLLLFLLFLPAALHGQQIILTGRVLDPSGNTLSNATIHVSSQDQTLATATSGPDGRFTVKLSSWGEFVLRAEAPGFRAVVRPISLRKANNSVIEIRMSQIAPRVENVTVSADVNASDVLSPDPNDHKYACSDVRPHVPPLRPAG